jgi:hypothetical protein
MVVMETELSALRFSVAASAGLIYHFLLLYRVWAAESEAND